MILCHIFACLYVPYVGYAGYVPAICLLYVRYIFVYPVYVQCIIFDPS